MMHSHQAGPVAGKALRQMLFVSLLASPLVAGAQGAASPASGAQTPRPQAASPAAASPAATSSPTASPSAAGKPQIRFKAPAGIGAAQGTLAGATRGNNREWLMFVAAPAGFGLSAIDQPVLYWYVSRAVNNAPEFMLVEVGAERPLMEGKLPVPASPGFQRIDLKAMGLRLEAGKEYIWQVSLDARSGAAGAAGRMVDATGRLRWITPPASLQPWLQSGDELAAAAALAEAGYWYDASARLRQLALRTTAADGITFSEAEASLYESAGLGHLVRKAADPR